MLHPKDASTRKCASCKKVKGIGSFYIRRRRHIKDGKFTSKYYENSSSYCKDCERKRASLDKVGHAKREKERRLQIKRRVIFHYSGGENKCVCCGEGNIAFLNIDHIDGGGKKHRAKVSGGWGGAVFYNWLIKNDFPPGYQVLCFNCNIGRYWNNGICPHQLKKL